MTTFSAVLSGRLRDDPGRPLVTFYDGAGGERTELSVATYANWVAKLASLLVEELDLERGMRLRVDLPAHWLGPIALGAAWTAGLEVLTEAGPGDAVLCGPASVGSWAEHAGDVPVVASALHPLGLRFPEPPPAGVRDLGVEIWSQPDSFVPWDPPDDDDPAIDGVTQAGLWPQPAASPTGDGGRDRLLTSDNPVSRPGALLFAGLLAGGGSLVLVSSMTSEQVATTYAVERATAQHPDPGGHPATRL